MRMYPAITPPHVYIRIRNRNPSTPTNPHTIAMPNTEQTQRTQDIRNAGQRVRHTNIRGSRRKLVAKASDSLYDAIDTVRSLEYQDHEPCNVFHPVVLADRSDKGGAPMSDRREDLAFASIHELAPKIEDGSVSPVELTQIALERVAKLDPKLNSFLDVWQDEALASAVKVEREIASGAYKGPMHGIPIGLKDLVDVEGKATTGGSKVLQSNIATSNATVTNRLNRAGAITLGKTNLVEMALGSAGVNPYTGDARNPWDTDKITGGSR